MDWWKDELWDPLLENENKDWKRNENDWNTEVEKNFIMEKNLCMNDIYSSIL